MAVLVDYVGHADIRIITAAQLLQAGFVSADLVWSDQNNHELMITDPALAAYLVAADSNFKVQSPERNFAQLVVGDVYGQSAAGMFESMNPKVSTLAAVGPSSSAETSLLDEDYVFPSAITLQRAWRVMAGGLVSNTSGAPVDFTVRLRDPVNGLIVSAVVTLASDAVGNRVWRFSADGEVNFFLANGQHTTSHLIVGKGNTDPLQQSIGQQLAAIGGEPQNWRVTGQFSVSHANIQAFIYSATIMHSLPGNP